MRTKCVTRPFIAYSASFGQIIFIAKKFFFAFLCKRIGWLRSAYVFAFFSATILSQIVFSISAFSQTQKRNELALFDYTVKDGDTLGEIYFRLGICRGDSGWLLYGPDGWLKKTEELGKWYPRSNTLLEPGETVRVAIPWPDPKLVDKIPPGYRWVIRQQELQFALEHDTKSAEQLKKEMEEKRLATERQQIALLKAEELRKQREKVKAIKKAPEKHTITEITKLPQAEIKTIPKKVLREKLTDSTVAKLDTKTIEKIPEDVKTDKAWQASIFDSNKPGMDRLFKNINNKTASAYASVRYGISLLAKDTDPLLSQAKFVGALLEARGGIFSGLRLLYETVPQVTSEVEGREQSIGWRKIQLGWAFEFKSPFIFDHFHLTPRLGAYALQAKVPIGRDDDNALLIYDVNVANAVALGLEGDAEIARFFYIIRLWAGQDFSLRNLGGSKDSDAVSTRYGLDLFLKGPGFLAGSTPLSLSFLVFVADESVQIGQYVDDEKLFSIGFDIPYAGLGLSLTW